MLFFPLLVQLECLAFYSTENISSIRNWYHTHSSPGFIELHSYLHHLYSNCPWVANTPVTFVTYRELPLGGCKAWGTLYQISLSSLKHFHTVFDDGYGSLRNSSWIYKQPPVVCYSNCGHYTNVNVYTLCLHLHVILASSVRKKKCCQPLTNHYSSQTIN